jgi:hypothetical protein
MGEFTGWTLMIVALVAWFNHIFTCFSEGLWGFLVAGAIMFPIGILHGVWLWFK